MKPALPSRMVMVRFGHLGDAVLTTGVLTYFGNTRGMRFTVVTRAAFADIFAGHPFVDKIIALKDEDLRLPRELSVFREIAATHAGEGLLDLHGNLRSRMLGAQWRGPVFRYSKKGAERRLFLASGKRLCGAGLRALSVPQRYASAIEKEPPAKELLLPAIALKEEERTAAATRLRGLFGKEVSPVALHPYATHALKAWPEKRWREFVELLEQAGLPWLVIGRGEKLFPNLPNDLTNESSLRETCALLSHCRVLVTGDSGPMHLASASGTRVVALFGPTTAEWGFYPGGKEDIVLERPLACRPCSLHGRNRCPSGAGCLAGILPQEVFAAATKYP